MSDRSYWFCSECEKYSDPQSLDYDTGLCWSCQEGVMNLRMTNTRRNKLRQVNESDRGSWCLFIKLDNTCGLKLYHTMQMRDATFKGQEIAAENGLAPQIGVKFDLNEKDTADLINRLKSSSLPYYVKEAKYLFGYTTEVVDTDTTKIPDDHGEDLIAKLKSIGFYTNDFIGAQVNMGITKQGKLVCFDFDAGNCYNYYLKNRIGPIV